VDAERNKDNIRRIFEDGFTQGHLEVVDECIAADAVDRHEFTPDEPDFPSHLKGVMTMLRGALPDLTMTVEDLVAEDDRVAARVMLTGTHTGSPLFGVPAAGRSVRVEQFHFMRCNDAGQGTVHWAAVGVEDLVAQLTGAGATP
jgi:predicted ester cyclase